MTNEPLASSAKWKVRLFTKWRLLLVLCLVGVVVLSAFHFGDHEIEVQVTSPTIEDMESTISATGTVVPLNDFAARATFAGIVDKIPVQLGQRVRPGEMLVQMRDQYAESRVANARAALVTAQLNDNNLRMNGSREDQIGVLSDVERAQIDQASAERTIAALKQLQQIGSASDAEISASAQRLQTANAAVEAATQRLHARYRPEDIKNSEAKIAADKASLVAEKVTYRNANITSPISGTVYLLPVKHYDFVQMGADLLHVADLKKLAVQANFFEPDINQLKIGETAKITWIGLPGHEWLGQIQSKPIAVTGEGVLRTGQCTVALKDDVDGLPVNTRVTVTVATQKHPHVLTLPREAVHKVGQSDFVYRVIGNRLKSVPIQIGLVSPMRVEIRKGLHPGDLIAVRGVGGKELKNNKPVKLESK